MVGINERMNVQSTTFILRLEKFDILSLAIPECTGHHFHVTNRNVARLVCGRVCKGIKCEMCCNM
jgi:hypothetical protein